MTILQTLLVAVALTLALAGVAFWTWMLIDCLTRETKEGQERLVWLVAIALTKLLGAALYYFLRYRRRMTLGVASGDAG
jgi:hypothetical protein